jgi:hypothetical protein
MIKHALLFSALAAIWMYVRGKRESQLPATDDAVSPYGDRDVADGSISGELARMDREGNT